MGSLAAHDDVIRLFPGIQDHASFETLSTRAMVERLEATLPLWQAKDNALIDIMQRRDDQLNVFLAIPANSKIQPRLDFD